MARPMPDDEPVTIAVLPFSGLPAGANAGAGESAPSLSAIEVKRLATTSRLPAAPLRGAGPAGRF